MEKNDPVGDNEIWDLDKKVNDWIVLIEFFRFVLDRSFAQTSK